MHFRVRSARAHPQMIVWINSNCWWWWWWWWWWWRSLRKTLMIESVFLTKGFTIAMNMNKHQNVCIYAFIQSLTDYFSVYIFSSYRVQNVCVLFSSSALSHSAVYSLHNCIMAVLASRDIPCSSLFMQMSIRFNFAKHINCHFIAADAFIKVTNSQMGIRHWLSNNAWTIAIDIRSTRV